MGLGPRYVEYNYISHESPSKTRMEPWSLKFDAK